MFRKKVKRSSVFIPYQNFSFPWPIIRYICTNAKSLTQLKLFSTCLQLKNFIAKARGCHVDAVYFSSKRDAHRLHIKEKRLIQLDLSYDSFDDTKTINFLQSPKIKSLHFDLGYVIYEEIITYLHKFDYSVAEKIDIWMMDGYFNQTLNIDVIRPMFVSSLTSLLLCPMIKLKNGDLLTIVLTELPKLRKLRMGWQESITNLITAALIPRTTKLELFDLQWIKESLTIETIFNFIFNQMSNICEIYFDEGYGFNCNCFYQETQELISRRFDGVKLEINPVYACSHK